jgi:hypothetical protein
MVVIVVVDVVAKETMLKLKTPLFKRYLTKISKTKLAKGSNISYAKQLSKPKWINLPIDTSTMIGKCYCLYL